MKSRPWGLFTVLLFALLLRLAMALGSPEVMWADTLEYHEYAANLVRSHAYFYDYQGTMTAWRFMRFHSSRPPGYPFFIAAVYAVAGIDPRALLLAQAVLDTLSTFLVFALGRRFLGRRAALGASALYALIAYRVAMLMSEVLAVALVLVLLLLFTSGPALRKKSTAIIGGAMFGYLVLVRPEMVIFAPLALLYYLWKLERGRAIRLAALFSVFSCLLVAPWLVRGYQVHGRFVFLTTIGGRTLLQGNDEPFDGHLVMLHVRAQDLGQPDEKTEVDMDQALYRATLEYLEAHPGHAALMTFKRLLGLWSPRMEGGDEIKYFFRPLWESPALADHALACAGWIGYAASRAAAYLGLCGMIIFWRRLKEFAALYTVPAWLSLFHFLFFYGIPRYLVPAYPALCVFAGMLGEAALRRRKTWDAVMPGG